MGINIAAVCGNAYTKRAILLAKRAKAGNAEIAEIEQERRTEIEQKAAEITKGVNRMEIYQGTFKILPSS